MTRRLGTSKSSPIYLETPRKRRFCFRFVVPAFAPDAVVTKCEGTIGSVSPSRFEQETDDGCTETHHPLAPALHKALGQVVGQVFRLIHPVLALAAILGLGAFSLWATSQHKSPQAAITALFQRPASKPNTQPAARTEPKATVTSKASESKPREQGAVEGLRRRCRPCTASIGTRCRGARCGTRTAKAGAAGGNPDRHPAAPHKSGCRILARRCATLHAAAWRQHSGKLPIGDLCQGAAHHP